jgi:hypothetical protein
MAIFFSVYYLRFLFDYVFGRAPVEFKWSKHLFFVPFYNFSFSLFIVTLPSLVPHSRVYISKAGDSDSLECHWRYTVTAGLCLGTGMAGRKRT